MAISLKPLRNENDYSHALDTIEKILDAEEGNQEADARDVLSILIEQYEEEHYPIDKASPIEAIKFRMDQLGLTQKDLVSVIGSRSKVSEILSGKRDLSLRMIRALRIHLNIPGDVLLGHRDRGDWDELSDIPFDQYPVQEMVRNGAFVGWNVSSSKILRGTTADNDAASEADQFAEAALLPTDFDLAGRDDLTTADIGQYSSSHSIHPAIIDGNIQYHRNDYRSFSRLSGKKTVRDQFQRRPYQQKLEMKR